MSADPAQSGLLEPMPGPDESAHRAVRARADEVLRPAGAFARLDELAAWLAGWQRGDPHVESPVALVFGADHGVVAAGVSAYPSEVTASIARSIREGIATASIVARSLGIWLELVDVGIGTPTGNIVVEDAHDEGGFARSIESGRAAVRDAVDTYDADLLVVGEFGIGNTTIAAAICAALFGGPPPWWIGPGAGLPPGGFDAKEQAVHRACDRVGSDVGPLEVLRRLGGSELAAIAGAVVEARCRSVPMVLDGYVTAAAVMPLELASPGALDHCVAGHVSGEPGHRRALERLGKRPLLDLSLALGEGTGGMLAVPLLRAAAAAVTDVGTFADLGLTR